MRAGTDAEVPIGRRDAQLAEEHIRHIVVIVLAGMNKKLSVLLAQFCAQGSRLDELRPGADDDDDAHPSVAPKSRVGRGQASTDRPKQN